MCRSRFPGRHHTFRAGSVIGCTVRGTCRPAGQSAAGHVGPCIRIARRAGRLAGSPGTGRERAVAADWDVAVVGAGAAGLSLAMRLARPRAGARPLTTVLLAAPPGPLRVPRRTWCYWEPG